MLSASSVLFVDNSDNSRLGSCWEDGPAIYAYSGNTLDPLALRDEACLDGFIYCKFVLPMALCRFCLP